MATSDRINTGEIFFNGVIVNYTWPWYCWIGEFKASIEEEERDINELDEGIKETELRMDQERKNVGG